LDDDSSSSSSQASILDESISATPFLDLFADAGIASVKKLSSKSASGSGQSLSSFKNMKPRGRPASVPGAMSRSTLMGMHEMQSRVAEKNRSMNKSRKSQISKNKRKKRNLDLDRIYNEGTTLTTAISSSRLGSKSSSGASRTTKSRATKKSSTSILKDISKKTKKKGGTGRGRGRPRKDKGNNASVDEITSIAATSAFSSSSASSLPKTANSKSDSKSKSSKNGKISKGEKSDIENKNDKVSSSATTTTTRSKRGELKTLRPKSKKMKDSEKEGESTGMMQQISGKFSKGGKDGEPPNLQKYYRTELLTPEEEYTLGTKIQFMIKCEQVHEGLYEKLGHYPSIVEWANACGYKEEDPNKDDKNYMQSEYANQIRPLKTDTFDPVEDANMFVGNGLVNASGPGRGRGRAKKPPPAELKDYYDDSDIKFDDDYKQKLKHLKPLNQGTPMQFVDFMVVAKQAKQRMVQCNMRLVVSISKRYKHVGVNIADLVQEGSIGLTRAAEKFDPKKGFKFSTYASWWIQQAVFRSIAYHSRTIRLPVHVHNLLNRTRRVRLELQRILGRAPTNEEMANELDMSIEKYNKMIRLTRKAISLDMAKYQNNPKDIGQESETSLGDTIDVTKVIRDENSPEQSVDRVLFRDDLKEMLKILGDDERAVIYARYGIEDGLSRTVTTVAAKMGQSKSWVRSQECRALRKLRRPWYEKRLWEHQNSLPGMI
jgi:RNA polymerase sigma factor (sigma-70 family)